MAAPPAPSPLTMWRRAGHPADLIGTIRVTDYGTYADATRRLFGRGPVTDSGIVISGDTQLADGGRIEKSCYHKDGFKFLVRPNGGRPDPGAASFPTDKLRVLLERLGDLYLTGVAGVEGRRAHLDSCWAVCQRAGDYGTIHNHVPPDADADCRYSGMLYLRTPRSINPRTFPNGCLYLITPASEVVYIPPIPGTATIWPARLLHGIHPFRGSGDRLGIAFDITSVQT